ncbi:MAG: hypothetical protein JWM18_337 [Chloroflexi bacterium]|nr:hypothetical protein [Chloroflexota bacterium]
MQCAGNSLTVVGAQHLARGLTQTKGCLRSFQVRPEERMRLETGLTDSVEEPALPEATGS